MRYRVQLTYYLHRKRCWKKHRFNAAYVFVSGDKLEIIDDKGDMRMTATRKDGVVEGKYGGRFNIVWYDRETSSVHAFK